ncbi:hypothetical protein EV363DRAFT_771831 [Boletus edulis]|nr:hypothetical protein EV363DRAFT_771831 [Boletus edulis]
MVSPTPKFPMLPIRRATLPNSSIPIAEADNSSGAHIRDTKRIGDLFPGAGYEDYYLLSPRSDLKLVSPHRIPISEFSDSLDLVKDVLTVRNVPVLRLSSDKSGLAVEFDSNQADLMFYTNNYTDAKGYRKKIHGGTGLHGDGYIPQCTHVLISDAEKTADFVSPLPHLTAAAFFEFHEVR